MRTDLTARAELLRRQVVQQGASCRELLRDSRALRAAAAGSLAEARAGLALGATSAAPRDVEVRELHEDQP